MVLKHINSKKVTLMSEKDSQSIEFNFDGFPYFGIWAAKEAPFVCLEPWCGIADNIDCNHQLIKKEGINQLAAGENWKRTWSIDMF